MIDGVLQLEFPRGPLVAAVGGPAPTLILGLENRLLAPPLERLLAVTTLLEGEAARDHAALHAEQFNPLTLVGPAGSGKSLVAQGVARAWSERLGTSAVAYHTAADFGRERQAAEADERLTAWRGHVRSVRLLVVDDVDRLRPRATIQRELRDTIDAIVDAGGIVVVTASREPYLCRQLDARLRDRLVAGLTARIERPGLAARRAILVHAAATRGMTLNDGELSGLAEAECSTPTQLIGRLNQHTATTVASPAGAGPSTARGEARTDSVQQLKHIVAVAARYFGVTQAAIISKSRRTSLVEVRNVIVHFARHKTELSYAEIGRALGGRDHTTIMHADRRLAERLSMDAALAQSVAELSQLLD